MTSTYVESTVKQINRRMKGTEKFWSNGVEPMLTLVADHLSDTPTLARFWRNRPHRLTGSRVLPIPRRLKSQSAWGAARRKRR